MGKHTKKSTNWLAESPPPPGQLEKTLETMRKAGIPPTRENYLEMIYLGKVPNPIPAEEEDFIPEMFRQK